MNPLNSVLGTIIAGFILAIIIAFAFDPNALNAWSLIVWLHVLAGITWIGLLYYFNFVQVPALGEATADSDGPGPAAIGKYVAPRALAWFRWGAFTNGVTVIGIGAWLGTIMLFNVWVLIWPNQKKVLGIKQASDDEKAAAKKIAFTASRINTLLSIPMLACMVAAGHGLFF